MKLLLFDQNVSPRLVERLSDLYPESIHVSTIGLGAALDIEIRQYAFDHGCMIVTKDADFSELGLVKGFPPRSFGFAEGTVRPKQLKHPESKSLCH